jgi:hypothetical protein
VQPGDTLYVANLPMIARFESGEVSLTTTIGKIGFQLGIGVMACDAATE